MSYNLSDDAESPPGANLPGISAANLRRVRQGGLALAALIILFLLLWWARAVYTDWLWFDHLGFRSVFTKILFLKAWLFVAGTLVAGLALTLSLYLTVRFSRGASTLSVSEETQRLLWALLAASAGLTVLIAGPIFGSAAMGRWETFLLFFNKLSFGASDPQFGLDISFYVVTLRLLHFVQGWFLGLIVTVIVVSLSLYIAVYSLRGVGFVLAPRMLKHAAVYGHPVKVAEQGRKGPPVHL